MSSPAPSASAAVRGEELYGFSPRPTRRPGMQKLQLPSQLVNGSNASSASSSSSSRRPTLPKLDASSAAGPSLSLSIPTSKSFSGMHTDTEEGYEGSAGVLTGAAIPAISTAMPTNPAHRSIYPDTVPYGGDDCNNTLNLTNDLRRAIGGIDLEGKSRRSYDGAQNGRSTFTPSTSGGSLGGFASPDKRLSVASSNASSHHEDVSVDSTSTVGQELEEESEIQLKGNLEVMERLGEGASGEVRKARYRPTKLIMAMKTISTSPNPAIHRQILRELSFNRTCHSDYIVKYYGAFLESEDTSIVICMEHCEAGSLDSIYKRCQARNGRMGEKILAKIAESGLKGLAYLHQRKIIHRDIKPSNMLVTREGQIKLCDFGVSGELINSMAGTFTGTSYYMAPERIRGLPYTITSDVWSLGLTILEMASNRFPFPPEGEPALGPIDLLSYIVSMKTPELKDDESSGIKWTRAFKDFLDNCLEKDGTKRHGPVKMLNHPFIKKTMSKMPQPNIAKFVAEVWGWKYVETAAEPLSVTQESVQIVESVPPPLENVNVPGIGRVASLRVAPSPFPAREALRIQAIKTSAPSSPKLARLVEPDNRKHSSGRSTTELDDRTEAERAIAKKREADVGLVGSPVEEF